MYKNDPTDMAVESAKMTGFWRGVVEDNIDPLKAGRVRVRIHGQHTAQKSKDSFKGIPTNELYWAEPCLPIIEGSISGFGSWSVPRQGSHVMCFFEGNNHSAVRYFATMPGIPESTDEEDNKRADPNIGKKEGFRDPDNDYPLKDRLGEPDVHRLARGRSNGTLVITKNDNRDIGVPEACGGTWSEPESPFNARYPENYVIATHGGVTVELDSTPGSTRLHLYHPSNSFIEIDNDGVMVVKNNDSKYEIVLSDHNIHVKRDRSLTTDGDNKRLTQGNECIEVNGNRTEKIVGDETREISGNVDETIDGDVDRTIEGDVDETINGDVTRYIDKSVDETIHGDLNGQLDGQGQIDIDGTLTLTVDGALIINGNGTVSINSSDIGAGASGGTRYYLMDERMISIYNNHTHYRSGGSTSIPEPPNLLAVGNHTTSDFTGS